MAAGGSADNLTTIGEPLDAAYPAAGRTPHTLDDGATSDTLPPEDQPSPPAEAPDTEVATRGRGRVAGAILLGGFALSAVAALALGLFQPAPPAPPEAAEPAPIAAEPAPGKEKAPEPVIAPAPAEPEPVAEPEPIDTPAAKAKAKAQRTDADGDGLPPKGEERPGRPWDCDDADARVGAPGRWYADGDSDGFGAGAAELACTAPKGAVADNTDCNDEDAQIHPGARERCNGQADACGALPANEADGDGDGYVKCAIDAAGWAGAASVVGGDDWDDADAKLHTKPVAKTTWTYTGDAGTVNLKHKASGAYSFGAKGKVQEIAPGVYSVVLDGKPVTEVDLTKAQSYVLNCSSRSQACVVEN